MIAAPAKGAPAPRVASGDRLEDEGDVGGGPRHRPHVVERPAQGHDAAAADAAVGGLDAGDAAERGGDAYGAAGVGAESAQGHAGGGGGAGAGGGGARPPVV